MEGQLFDGNWSSSQTRARKPTHLERESKGGRERGEERGEGEREEGRRPVSLLPGASVKY